MSEENVNESSEEQQENASPAEKSEFPPEAIAVIGGLREELRTEKHGTAVALAEMKGQIDTLHQVNTAHAPAAKSPLDLRAEEDDCSVGEVRMDGDLYQKQQAWDRQQANLLAQDDMKTTQMQSAAAAKIAHEDYGQVLADGEELLNRKDLDAINKAGSNFGEVAYEKCQAAIKRNKPVEEAAPELSESEQKTKDEADAVKKAEEAEKGKSQDEILADAVKSSDPHADYIVTL